MVAKRMCDKTGFLATQKKSMNEENISEKFACERSKQAKVNVGSLRSWLFRLRFAKGHWMRNSILVNFCCQVQTSIKLFVVFLSKQVGCGFLNVFSCRLRAENVAMTTPPPQGTLGRYVQPCDLGRNRYGA